MRPIDADSVIRQMMRGYNLMMEQMADRSAEVRGAMEDARLLFTYAVHDEPSLDVAPVKHGKWEVFDDCANRGYYCNACHKKIYEKKPRKHKLNFCPNCGAKMDAGQEDDNDA